MPANWEAFNQDLGGIGSALGQWAREKKAKEDAIQQIIAKAQIEQMIKQSDPYQTALTRMMGQYSRPDTINTTAKDTSGNVVGVNQNDFYMKPSFGPSGPSFSMEQTPQASLRNKIKETKAIERIKPKTSDEAGTLAIAPEFQKSINNILGMVQSPGFKWGGFGAFRTSLGHPSLVSGMEEKMQNELNNLKRSAFAEGGKNLTKTERDIIFRLLEPVGKEMPNWINDLQRANRIIQSKAKMIRGETDSNSESVSLPPEIKTTSQAVQYLMSNGMSQEDAINWIRSQ